jgi:hypothetical protein
VKRPFGHYVRPESSGAGFRVTKDLAMYKPMPAPSHQSVRARGSQTISSRTENIHNAATILAQAHKGLSRLCGQANPTGISQAVKNQPKKIFVPRLTRPSYCRKWLADARSEMTDATSRFHALTANSKPAPIRLSAYCCCAPAAVCGGASCASTPMASPERISSTRRFCARPSTVSFDAIGSVLP